MDIVRRVINLKGDEILVKIKQIISESELVYQKIFSNDSDIKTKIKLLTDDTFIFDTYMGITNMMILICDRDDYKNWVMAEKNLKDFNNKINQNEELFNFVVESIKTCEKYYDKIFLAKIARSLDKTGIRTNSKEKINKIILQLENTENNILNTLDKAIQVKLDRSKIDARSDSIMSSVYPDENDIIFLNKQRYYFLLKKISDQNIRKELEEKFMKKYISILPLVGKLIILRDAYARYMQYPSYYYLVSEKTEEETENIQQLITDLNDKLDIPLSNILKEFQKISTKPKISLNDIIYLYDKNFINIKLRPVDILQIVMITIQKKFNILFKHSSINLSQNTNCIEVYKNNMFKGYIILDLVRRPNKRISQITTIKINSNYNNNLPILFLLGCYNNLEENTCNYSELVLMFREFGNILINICAHTPNGLNEIDIEMFNFFPNIMEFMAYDDFTTTLVLQKIYAPNKIQKKIKELKTARIIDLLINLKLKCMSALFDNVIHNSSNFINKIKKQELDDISKSFVELYQNIFKDIFSKHLDVLEIPSYINPNIILNTVNGNHGLLFGSILSLILSYVIYYLLVNRTDDINIDKFIDELLENKLFSYKKIILDFISKININYFKLFIEKCLNIADDTKNSYDELTENC
jgi:Zn-dependent oligopeptidase